MHDVGGKLLNCIKSMHVHNLACVRVKRCERAFSIDNGVRQGYVMFVSWWVMK